MNNIINSDNNNNDYLFFKVFRNKYLKKKIFTITKLYKSYHSMTFGDRDKLLNFQFREYVLTLTISGNMVLLVGDIPETVEHIRMPFYYMNKIEKDVLPQSLKSIHFGNLYNHSISGGILPSSIKRIRFGLYFNNQKENLSVGDLPSSLEYLSMSSGFNSTSLNNGVLPKGLKELHLEAYDIQFLEGDLPESLIKLHLGNSYYHTFGLNVLPPNLQYLSVGSRYKAFIPNSIPPSVRILNINSTNIQKLNVGDIPFGVLELLLPPLKEPLDDNVIPNSVTKIQFHNDYNQPIKSLGVIPHSVKSINFGPSFNSSIVKEGLGSVESLIFGESFNQSLKDILPSTLKSLVIESEFYDQVIEESYFPPSLTSLTINFPFKKSIHSIPQFIKEFTILGYCAEDLYMFTD